jgi:hypothetical protein
MVQHYVITTNEYRQSQHFLAAVNETTSTGSCNNKPTRDECQEVVHYCCRYKERISDAAYLRTKLLGNAKCQGSLACSQHKAHARLQPSMSALPLQNVDTDRNNLL